MASSTNTRSSAAQSFFLYVKDPSSGKITRIAIPSDVQIGLDGSPAELMLTGRLSVAGTTYTIDRTNNGTINVSPNDTVVAISLKTSPSLGRISCFLPPAPRDGELHFFKDMTGTAATVPIDIFPSIGMTIDGAAKKTLTDALGSLALIFLDNQWRLLVAGIGSSGGGGADVNASYVLVNPDGSLLPNARTLSGSINIIKTDTGPGGSVSFDLSHILGTSPGSYSNATVTVDQFGRVTNIAAGGASSDPGATYALVTATGSLPNARQVTAGLGINIVDAGPSSTLTWNLQELADDPGLSVDGMTVLLPRISDAGPTIYNSIPSTSSTVICQGDPNVVYAVSLRIRGVVEQRTYFGGANDGAYWQVGGAQPLSSDPWNVYLLQVSEPSGTYYLNRGTSGQFHIYEIDYTKTIPIAGGATVTLSGSTIDVGSQEIANNSNTGGPLSVPGITSPSQPYLGQFVIINYVTSSAAVVRTPGIFVQNGGILVPSGPGVYSTVNAISGVFLTDNGPVNSGIVTLGVSNQVFATLTGSTFSGPVNSPNATGGFTGSLTQTGIAGNPFMYGVGATSILTNSLGQVGISSSVYADPFASFTLLFADPKLTQARTLAAGTGVTFIDGGPGGTLTIISTGAGGSSGGWIDTGAGLFTTSSVSIDGQSRTAQQVGTDVWFFISGSAGVPPGGNDRLVSLFGGDVYSSGTITSVLGFTGSLTKLANGNPYLIGQNGISFSSNSAGQVIASGTLPHRTYVAGAGGTSASYATSPGDGTFTVSSSIYAFASSSFIVAVLDAENPNERTLAGLGGTSVSDGGVRSNFTVSSSIYANPSSSYVVISIDAENPNERKLTAGTGISISDGGAGGNVTISTSSSIGAFASASYLVAVLDAENPNERRVTGLGGTSVIDNGAGSTFQISSSIHADVSASYLILDFNAEDPNARKLVAGSNVSFSDTGPGGTLTITAATGAFGVFVDQNGTQVGTSLFTSLNFSGGVTATDGGGGTANITVTGGGGGGSAQWTDGGNKLYTTSSVSIDSSANFATQHGPDIFFYVSGTTNIPQGVAGREAAVFGGDTYTSGTAIFLGGLTGSLTKLPSGNPYMIGQGGISISTNSLGQANISGSISLISNLSSSNGISITNVGSLYGISGTVYADAYAGYLLTSASVKDPQARVVQASGSISLIDGGGGGAFIIFASGSFLTGPAASRPTAVGSGKAFLCTDIPVMYVDDALSGTWLQFAGEYMPKCTTTPTGFTQVPSASFSMINWGDSIRAMKIRNTNTADVAVVAALNSLSASQTWVVTMTATAQLLFNNTFPTFGPVVTNGIVSSTSQLWGGGMYYASSPSVHFVNDVIGTNTRNNVYNEAGTNSSPWNAGTGRFHARLLNDGTNLHFQFSNDGFMWQDWSTITCPSGLSYWGFMIGTDSGSGNSWAQAVINSLALNALTVAQQSVTAATGNGVAVKVTVTSTAGFYEGDYVAVHGMAGNTAANTGTGGNPGGSILITAINSATQMTLNATGNGSYTSGGAITLLSR